MNVTQTLAELVRVDSVSAHSNLEIIKLLAARAESLGLCTRLLPYTDERGVKKFNLIAVAPRATAETDVIELALVGHTDTVQKPQNSFIFCTFFIAVSFITLAFRTAFTQDSHKV